MAIDTPTTGVGVVARDQRVRDLRSAALGDSATPALARPRQGTVTGDGVAGERLAAPTEAVDEEDVNLDEFSDEIDGWIIDELKAIGCDTAKNVLSLSREDLIKRTDLEEETIDEVLRIFRAEFE